MEVMPGRKVVLTSVIIEPKSNRRGFNNILKHVVILDSKMRIIPVKGDSVD